MKLLFTVALSCIGSWAFSQTLGNYSISGWLSSAVCPSACPDAFVTGTPDDSLWVNFYPGDTVTGLFNTGRTEMPGADLLLESGFDDNNYGVRLLLSSGQYSPVRNIVSPEWDTLPVNCWSFVYGVNCTYYFCANASHYILPLDFSLDFGLTPTDTVIGLEIAFQSTIGVADFAGAYYIGTPTGNVNQLTNTTANISPNPFSDFAVITFGENTVRREFTLYDLWGREVGRETGYPGMPIIINRGTLLSGIYFYRIISEDGRQTSGKIEID